LYLIVFKFILVKHLKCIYWSYEIIGFLSYKTTVEIVVMRSRCLWFMTLSDCSPPFVFAIDFRIFFPYFNIFFLVHFPLDFSLINNYVNIFLLHKVAYGLTFIINNVLLQNSALKKKISSIIIFILIYIISLIEIPWRNWYLMFSLIL